MDDSTVMQAIRRLAQPFGSAEALDSLVAETKNATYVLLGEASHGTSEFYSVRAEITKRLITEEGFRFIAVEGDWPSCYTLNRYIKGYPDAAPHARAALSDYTRWPAWMWANREILELAEWLRSYNEGRPDEEKAGFYGIDMYSLWESMDEILKYLSSKGSPDLEAAKQAFECFEPFGRDEQSYGISASLYGEGCARAVVWEHNTHIGDARATDMEQEQMVNVGQLLREKYDNAVYAVGFGTYGGTVIAGRAWGAPPEIMQVPPAMKNSWEELLHRDGAEDKLLLFSREETVLDRKVIGHRAIGVVYHPERERGNYVPSILTRRYDAFIYLDHTRALSPVEMGLIQA